MTSRPDRWIVFAAFLLAGSSASVAQQKTPWVDPPGASTPVDETVTFPELAAKDAGQRKNSAMEGGIDPGPSADQESTASISSPSGKSVSPAAGPRDDKDRGSRTVRRDVPKDVPKKATTSAAKRGTGADVANARTQGNGRRAGVGAADRRFAERAPPFRRVRSVQEALDLGLSVTTIRTYRLPDGREIEVVTETDPRTNLDLMVRPF